MDPVEPGLACGRHAAAPQPPPARGPAATAAAGLAGGAFPGPSRRPDPSHSGCSDTAHLSLLGYEPRTFYKGRGAFESMGAGLHMEPGDIAFKCNFATVNDLTGEVVSRRADRHFEREGPLLCAALDNLVPPSFADYKVNVRYATEHRCGVVIRGPLLSGNISGTDPLKDHRLLLRAEALDGSQEAAQTASIVNEVSDELRKILREHPLNAQRAREGKQVANVILLRGCGLRIEVPTFEQRHGLRACMVAPTKIIAGLGLSLDMSVLPVVGATGDYRTLLTLKAAAIAEALGSPAIARQVLDPGRKMDHGTNDHYDFGFLHIKAVDDAGHDKSSELKLQSLEAVDRMVLQLARMLWDAEVAGLSKYTLCVTGDHSTPVEYGDHSFEPVPFAMCHLAEFVEALGGAAVLQGISLETFPITANWESPPTFVAPASKPGVVVSDTVDRLSEISAARGCLGRFQGGSMLNIIKAYCSDFAA
eukprot:SM000111S18820  [mRNA]  locus=s111:369107:371266:+ [translate_table: standard]